MGATYLLSGSPGARAPLFTAHDLLLLLYLYPFRFLSAFASRDVLYRIAGVAEPILQFYSREWKNAVMRRMLAAPCLEMTPDRAAQIARRLVSNASFRLMDDLVLSRPSLKGSMCRADVRGIEHLEQAKSAGKGVVILTGHFYAGRLARRYLATIGYPLLTVRHQMPSEDLAGRFGSSILQPRLVRFLHEVIQDEVYVQDPGFTLKILQRLRSGGLVNIHFDARHGARTVESRLLGVQRHFATGIFDIVRLSGCAVVPMLCLGRSAGLRIIFDPMLDIIDASGRDEFVAANLPSFVQTIEKQITGNPEEWTLWMRL